MKKIQLVGLFVGTVLISISQGFCQNTLHFTGVNATAENAMQLHWASNTNEIYEIDEADALVDTNTGSITWNTLYENYPSQGTNTLWLDTGNYFTDPEILHPSKMPMRLYRVTLTGTNTLSAPSVSITSLTNGFDASGDITVTVTANSVQYFLSTKLYVDGQEMNVPDTSTNWTDSGGTNYITDTYVINSCEWPNGSHTLFGTAYCQSGASGAHNASTIGIGYGVSPYVSVIFDNLVTRISFSQPFFTPEDGQIQQVTASFTANANWTLQIQDVNSNTVRTATGSGTSMLFNWDGKDGSGVDLPVGNYTYLFTVQTNGSSFSITSEESSIISSSFDDSAELWASPTTDWTVAVPLALYPPGFDTNGFTIFEASPSEMLSLRSSEMTSRTSFAAMDAGSGAASQDYNGASAQTSRAPKRPPVNPVKGRAGVYGVAYQTYSANGAWFELGPPLNGVLTQHVLLEGKTTVADSTFDYDPLPQYKREANNFIEQMKKGNWSRGFARVDDKLSINDLRGSGTIYNSVKLGLVLLHGTYGSGLDYTVGGCKQMYFPITAGHGAQYIRMSEMNFGSSATNGLKWMAISACNSLFHTDWSNMQSLGVKPYNSNLHLLLGTDSTVYTDDHIMELWAKYMTKGRGTNAPMTIKDAWVNSASDAYHQTRFNYPITMKFAVAGDSSCISDTLNSTSTPGGSWAYSSTQVYP